MVQSYKVFLREKEIFLTWRRLSISSEKSSLVHHHDSVDSLQLVFKSFQHNDAFLKLFVGSGSLEKLWRDFKSMFEIIEAAGGVIKNSRKEVLFIFRNGKWDLPKGKIEMGEKVRDAAIREVKEECGISRVKIIKKMAPTYHIYSLVRKNILKKTHWFEMEVEGIPKLKPQVEEGISVAKWVDKKEISELMKKTYPSVKELFVGS